MKNNYFKLLIIIFVTLFIKTASFSQTTLSAGDMMIIGCDLNANIFRVVLLKDITSNTVIKFTDIGWLTGTPGAWETNSSNLSGEGTITWTTTTSLASGTVLDLNFLGSGMASLKTVEGSPQNQSIVVNQMSLADVVSSNGENLFVYQGNASNPYFVTGFNNIVINTVSILIGLNGWTPDGSYINGYAITSNLPNGNGSQNALTDGINALGMIDPCRQVQVQYTGPTTATDISTWKSRFMNRSNWSCGSSGVTNSVANTITILPLAVSEFETISNLKLYPNPMANSLNIDFQNLTNASVTIYDVNGRLLRANNLTELSNTIPTSDFQKGIYFFKIQSNEGSVTKRIVKE
ncbi:MULTISPECIES: T9SS type A sorting domain-containing protein [Flavobacterium]|uniref:T9SS type A sorting domain-containing protein n=1 Tax=Flavobacterium hankyongi TaxID=1176532 RepID=A0ABP8ZKC5_9FLAO|nr:T9SS type A sorting domain-containing protein [Flavobacterium sp. N1846]